MEVFLPNYKKRGVMYMELQDTVKGMLSDDFKERLQAEIDQVRIRISKLELVMDSINWKRDENLEESKKEEYGLLQIQYNAMITYLSVLNVRMDKVKEELEIDFKGAEVSC